MGTSYKLALAGENNTTAVNEDVRAAEDDAQKISDEIINEYKNK